MSSRAFSVAALLLLLTTVFAVDRTRADEATTEEALEITAGLVEISDNGLSSSYNIIPVTAHIPLPVPGVLVSPEIESPIPMPVPTKNGDIYSFIIHSKIKYRYAQTLVSSRLANKGNTSKEVQFYVTLPESAFVSKFLMEVNEKVYEAYVKEKKEAKEEYIAAVNSGQTAAHVEQNTRDSNKFTVSVNVEAESKVTFNLTYEQLLPRKLGVYENIINIQPGQVVKNLQVIVDIEESSNITSLEVPDIKTVNEIETASSKNKLAQISYESGNKATIKWSPTVKEQLTFTELGVKGQFIVLYDIDHKSKPNEILIDDGYFVNFFAPTDLKPLRTHVIFVLDVSGSMAGQKLQQVREAMGQILSEIHREDFFTLIIFSDFAQVWTINARQETSIHYGEVNISSKDNYPKLDVLGENRYVFPATEQNIQYAKKFIHDNMTSDSSTNMEDALVKAHTISKLGEKHFTNGSNTPKPIIVFLTDGEPTSGISVPHRLIEYVSNINEEKYPIFSLGFGGGADIDFLKKLSLNNSGFARVIYEASDASLQLHNFYKEISSPVLSNVTFKYLDTQVDNITVTKKSFNLLFRGTELVVAGKLINPKYDFNSTLYADSTEGNIENPTFVTCFDIPPVFPNTEKRPIGHLEKLWAYLHIQQLMDDYELNKNENSTAKAKALELALRYSFVTPLTSLVVVKPNDTTTSANPEKIKPLDDRYNSVVGSQSSKFGTSFGLVMNAYSAPPSMSTGYIIQAQYASFESEVPQISDVRMTTYGGSYKPSKNLNSTLLYNITEISWLNVFNNTQPSITLNATNTVYQVLLNTTGETYQNCTTPDQVQGNCKHLKDCVVVSILDSLDDYIPLFCLIENIYAGICCLV